MSIPNVPQTDTFDQWRVKTNTIATNAGDLDNLNIEITNRSNTISAVNQVQTDGKRFSVAMAIALG